MKRVLLIIILVCCFGQSSCERDDICAETTPTTPLLIIRFYDADNPAALKAPNNLSIITLDPAEESLFLETSSASIAIPLRTTDNTTTYAFTVNSNEDDIEPQNEDIVTFTYLIEQEYVNKACGFRVIYSDLDNGVISQEDGPWIQNIDIENAIINDQAQAHISIFH